MAGQFTGKVALVTGAGSGIGRASALAFSREGARVVVCDVKAEGAEETVHLITAGGGESRFQRADVPQAADVAALIGRTLQDWGRLDYAHNNAGVWGGTAQSGELADYPEELFDQVIAVNLKGVWLGIKYEIPPMIAQGGCAIVNTASVMGLVASRAAAYTASKHGVIG